ncbi:MAG: fucose isomerase [Pyrobaculum sp.]
MAYVFASPIHGTEYISEVLEAVGKSVGLRREGPPPKVPLVVHATGGTTWNVVDFVVRGGARGAVLVGFGEHNSLASALHTRAELESLGVPSIVFHCTSFRDCGAVLQKAKAVADAASLLLGARAVLIGRATAQVEAARRLGWTVEVVPLEEFEKAVDAADPDEDALKLFNDVKVAKITSALRKYAEGRDLAAIQCFPYLIKHKVTPCLALALLNSRGSTVACEGDLAAGFAMLLSRRLSGYSGWISNVVHAAGGEAAFAHCTISLDMAKSWRLMPHFESGYPHGLAAELAHDVYTVVSVSPRLDAIAVGKAAVRKSGNFMKDACRTQALVDFGKEVDIPAKAPANHHVFIPGDHVEEVKAVAKLLNMRLVEY